MSGRGKGSWGKSHGESLVLLCRHLKALQCMIPGFTSSLGNEMKLKEQGWGP